jgi:hypothetical protein
MSPIGTNQTNRDACCLAAFGCKADAEPFSTRENTYTTAYTKRDALVKNVGDFKPLQRDQRTPAVRASGIRLADAARPDDGQSRAALPQ